jgi:hypothetical protein
VPPTRAFRAISKAAIACSLLTAGNALRKASSVSPASRQSIRFLTGTRVPTKTGIPPKIFESLWTTDFLLLVVPMSERYSKIQQCSNRAARSIIARRSSTCGVREKTPDPLFFPYLIRSHTCVRQLKLSRFLNSVSDFPSKETRQFLNRVFRGRRFDFSLEVSRHAH